MAGRGHLAAIYGGFPEGMGALVIEITTCERGVLVTYSVQVFICSTKAFAVKVRSRLHGLGCPRLQGHPGAEVSLCWCLVLLLQRLSCVNC